MPIFDFKILVFSRKNLHSCFRLRIDTSCIKINKIIKKLSSNFDFSNLIKLMTSILFSIWYTGWVNSERSESYVFPVQDKNMIQTPLYMIFHSASPKNIFDYTGWGITQVRMSTFFFQMEHPIFCHIFLLAFKIGL